MDPTLLALLLGSILGFVWRIHRRMERMERDRATRTSPLDD